VFKHSVVFDGEIIDKKVFYVKSFLKKNEFFYFFYFSPFFVTTFAILFFMINENIMIFLLLYAVLEVYEVLWQKGDRVVDMLGRIYRYYHKSVFLVLLMHPTFYFAIFFTLYTQYNGYAMALFVVKGVDVATKLILVKQVFVDRDIPDDVAMMLQIELGNIFPFIGLVVYLPLIYMALGS